ncbi:phage/plasmid replication protein [Methylobacter sp. S3L5C]|uniref:phage/plasmid replication domain-containing protein n=1 Tax=Methylobacter sp. S3L5C TaxID=2839024 RepID=UPI001FAD6C77|nr:phage/plasmid replication protein [Methylobacter sp. S3L5C]UOA07507.1 hypothetical protein KKZ03_14695 [Methylobacter sp. S3L5C]
MDNFFIDKLNVTQDYLLDGQQLPFVGKEGFYRFDLDTGETQKNPLISDLRLEGSYSSMITIKCDGFRISVYGNPSRWARMDNLFGLKTFEQCIGVYNHILKGFGLPLLTKCTGFTFKVARDGARNIKVYNGAIIKHVDFTRNLSVGLGNEKSFMKALSSHSINRSIQPYLYPNENTVEWYSKNIQGNGSTYRYVKVYCKTTDLLKHQKKHCKGGNEQDYQYYEDLLQYTVKNGVVREEHSFKREYLARNDLCAYGLVKEEDFKKELQVITEIRQRLEVSKMSFETIADQLIEAAICKSRQSANATQFYYSLWLHGEPMIRNTQFKVHKKRLLQVGIDISQKLDISRSPLRLKSCDIIEVKQLSMPDWYRKPKVPTHDFNPKTPLRLVA